MRRITTIIMLFTAIFMATSCSTDSKREKTVNPGEWPEVTNTQKPWTRWWWMGSAVDKDNITKNLEYFAEAGIGGVEITPIYGVKGSEDKYIDFLSPEYIEILRYTVDEGERLGLQVDMVLGTGWPFGGPQVEPENAATRLAVQKYSIAAGNKLEEAIVINDPKQKGLASINAILAFDNKGAYEDITSKIDSLGNLDWTPTEGDWTVYAVFAAKTRQMVKRAAPGGAGYTLDHFAAKAFADYVEPYDSTLEGINLRAIFDDSYEVYGADFTSGFFDKFKEYRGYDLRPLMDKFMDGDSITRNMLLADYRETLSDLLINDFATAWRTWSNGKGYLTKFQAHGAPANLIDLYAAADIPECETFGSTLFQIPGLRRDSSDIRHVDPDPMMLKFASSAAHLAGHDLVSSESFTWLADHFKVSLSQCKPELEQLFLAGVNHVFLHGSTYSPVEAAWPGWKFYAAVNFNYNNTIWKDIPAFFEYAARCQSMLQLGHPDNELLVYWPYFDAQATASTGKMFHQFTIHSIDKWLHPTNAYKVMCDLQSKGFSFDLVSDKFINEATIKNGLIVMPSGNSYKAIVIPSCERMLPETLAKLEKLKSKGANIIFEATPSIAPGYFDIENRNAEMAKIASQIEVKSDPIAEQLTQVGINGEEAASKNLSFIRRKTSNGTYYYFVNLSADKINDYITLETQGTTAVLFDALTGEKAKAKTQINGDKLSVLLQLEPGESMFVGVFANDLDMPEWHYISTELPAMPIEGEWSAEFIDGGPSLPAPVKFTEFKTWEQWSPEAEAFSGTVRYSIVYDAQETGNDEWILDLGNVRESARIFINGNEAGTLWSIPFRMRVGKWIESGENRIDIEVTNLGANRIRALEMSGQEWKIFHEINIVDVGYHKFDATKWNPTPSGLTCTPKLIPVNYMK